MNPDKLTDEDWLYFTMSAPILTRRISSVLKSGRVVTWHLETALNFEDSEEYFVINEVRYIPVCNFGTRGIFALLVIDSKPVTFYLSGAK